MRPALALVLVAIVFTSPAIAAACRLSKADCGVVTHERSAARAADLVDERTFMPTMPKLPRGKALIERHFDRMAARAPHLPKRIADEVTRLALCDAKDEARALREQALALPLSRATVEELAGPPIDDDPRCVQ